MSFAPARPRAVVLAERSLVGEHVDMKIRAGLAVPDELVVDSCDRHGVRPLAVFGSALRDDFRDDSDIDVLVEFQPGRVPGTLTLAAMELELLGREVELRTYEDLSRHFRDRVRASARELYAAA